MLAREQLALLHEYPLRVGRRGPGAERSRRIIPALLHEYPVGVGRFGPHFSWHSAGATLQG